MIMKLLAAIVVVGIVCPLVVAAGDPPLVFASFGFGTAVSAYGYKSIESALLTYPSMETFILGILENDDEKKHSSMLNESAKTKMTFMKQLTEEYLYPIDRHGNRQTVTDFSLAHIRAIGLTLRYVQKHHPNAHLVYHDLDILHFQPTLHGAFHKTFTLGLMTRQTQLAAANNCGLIMFHNSRIDEAASFFEFALHLYVHGGYITKRLEDPESHSCCSQHSIQHALELILGSAEWERGYSEYTYHHRSVHAVVDAPSCVTKFPGITKSFTLMSYPFRFFAPPADPSSRSQLQPFSETGALHYKGDLKSYMAADYTKMLTLLADGYSLSEVALKIYASYKTSFCNTPCCLKNVDCPVDRKVRGPITATCSKHPSFVSKNYPSNFWELFYY